MNTFEKKELKKKSENISDWYTDVILKSELADYAPVKGCMVIRPYGYAIWESIQGFLDRQIKDRGVKNAYFPIFIPEKFLKMEKKHVEGFSPHLAIVTEAGGEKLKEKLVVRPTSETVMYQMYKQWAQSYRDLPILINQWNNIVRWEKRTYLFLRTSEFLWQEGHCAHTNARENLDTVLWALSAYQKTYNELMGMYGIAGMKSESEKFAGGDKTYTFEILMPDGKALQACTSHDLGQNFAKAFDWTVLDREGKKLYPYQNSWGFSTRSIGGLILVCGDDNGLILPPNIAPIQIVVVPIISSKILDKEKKKLLDKAASISKDLKLNNIRVETDLNTDDSVGRRFNYWELKGVPLRIEIGEREIVENSVTIARRDNFTKEKVKIDDLLSNAKLKLQEMQNQAFERHKKFTQDNTHTVNSYDKFKEIMVSNKGFIRAFWCENKACEDSIKADTKATTRCLPLNSQEEKGQCIYCKRSASHRWYFAQAY